MDTKELADKNFEDNKHFLEEAIDEIVEIIEKLICWLFGHSHFVSIRSNLCRRCGGILR